MSDDAKPGYLRGRGSRGRGTSHGAAAGDRIVQGPGRQNSAWNNEVAPSTDGERLQHWATSSSPSGGNCAHTIDSM